ncbi:MAG: hypothetical protein IPM34_06835 [Saprospiraceae bacterium]|nr:hypothetical protein [Saprospiraceae bacterium]
MVENPFQISVWKISMILAPLFLAISRIYREGAVLGETEVVLQILGSFFVQEPRIGLEMSKRCDE